MEFLKKVLVVFLMVIVVVSPCSSVVHAVGPTYEDMDDTYYTHGDVTVYAGPDYESQVLTVISDNVPVHVIGKYSNGWYRINIGAIGYVKIDSVTTSWDRASNITNKQQTAAAQNAAKAGYTFHNLVLNDEKRIKKDVFNSYIGSKNMTFAVVDDMVGVSFKYLFKDPVKSDIRLNFNRTVTNNGDGSQTIELLSAGDTQLYGQLAIFQISTGYDKEADIYIWDMDEDEYVFQGTVYSEKSEYAYFVTTQISNMKIISVETERSLTDTQRKKMNNIAMGVKYLGYDEKDYYNMIGSRLRKDTEYVDFNYNGNKKS